jgi:hypothetical protein
MIEIMVRIAHITHTFEWCGLFSPGSLVLDCQFCFPVDVMPESMIISLSPTRPTQTQAVGLLQYPHKIAI